MSLGPRTRTAPLSPMAVGALGTLLATACGTPADLSEGSAPRGLVGKDGVLEVNTANVQLNRYAALGVNAAAGDTRILLRDATPLLPLAKGDLLMLYQAQGATINTTNSAAFGTVQSLGNSGRYELVTVDSVNNNTVVLDVTCGLRNSYTASGGVQVIRVPQYQRLTVRYGASVTAPPWDGSVGGVVAIHATEQITVDGAVDVSGRGFRGGQIENLSLPFGQNSDFYASANAAAGGEKGESIAGGRATYEQLGVLFGRGAPANGGGGGVTHNSSGGGGGGGDNAQPWTGLGVMDSNITGAMAWAVDPAVVAAGGQLASSSGGGRGGYSYSISLGVNNPDPVTTPPGDQRWGGDRRRSGGGLGGRPLKQDPADRIFFGGGGGAGDGNNDASTPGGRGGGVVLLISDRVDGSGMVSADGATPPPTRNGNDDGSGGGGGGGAIVIAGQRTAGLTLSAGGGGGGNQQDGPGSVLGNDREAEGPGGGGGGGYVAVGGGAVTSNVNGGAAGVTASPFVSRFPQNGATRGARGLTLTAATLSPPVCVTSQQAMPDGGAGSPDLSSGPAPDLGGGGNEPQPDLAPGTGGHSYAGGGVTCSVGSVGSALPRGASAPLVGSVFALFFLLLRRRRPSGSAR